MADEMERTGLDQAARRGFGARAELANQTDDAAHERWLEVHHRVPRHCHDIRFPLLRGRHQ
jgi:hypothetical protein